MQAFYSWFSTAKIMPKKSSGKAIQARKAEKAIEARKYRSRARDKRQLNNIIACYVEHKYKAIYDECNGIYQSVKEKYP